jgi:hypothetical protein
MRFNTQTTTTISPMIPRTNQTVRLISTPPDVLHPLVGAPCLLLVVSYQPDLPCEPTRERRSGAGEVAP